MAFPSEFSSIDEFEKLYAWTRLSLDQFHKSVLDGTLTASISDFVGLTPNEVNEHFRSLTDELENAYILKLVAASEGIFRKDFFDKVRKGKRSGTSLKDIFLKLHLRHGDKIKFEEHIIKSWKRHGNLGVPSVLSELKVAFKFRHWIAHGKYWVFEGNKLEFQETLIIVNDALKECQLI